MLAMVVVAAKTAGGRQVSSPEVEMEVESVVVDSAMQMLCVARKRSFEVRRAQTPGGVGSISD
jgi:hypothetical protein